MAFFRRRDPDITVDDTSFRAWKATLANEIASSKSSSNHKSAPKDTTARASRWVAEDAEGLYVDRPDGRQRRSVSYDSPPVRDRRDRNTYQPKRLFALGGVFGARWKDASGQVPTDRWPDRTLLHVEPTYQERPFYQPPGLGGCTVPGCTCGR